MAMRAAMHRDGASALSQLLQGDPPGPGEREVPCPCGHQARYRRCVRGACGLRLERSSSSAPGTGARIATTGSALPMPLWISRKRIPHPVSAACGRWSARKPHSTMDASRSNCWPARLSSASGRLFPVPSTRDRSKGVPARLSSASGRLFPVPSTRDRSKGVPASK